MRVLRPVTQSLMLFVFHHLDNLSLGRVITLEFIHDDTKGSKANKLKQCAEKLFGSTLVMKALHQDIKDLSLFIDRSP
jgi:hypothetical protein